MSIQASGRSCQYTPQLILPATAASPPAPAPMPTAPHAPQPPALGSALAPSLPVLYLPAVAASASTTSPTTATTAHSPTCACPGWHNSHGTGRTSGCTLLRLSYARQLSPVPGT